MGERGLAWVAAEGFECVAEGVAEVEDAPDAEVAGVLLDYGGLDFGTGGNHAGLEVEAAGEYCLAEALVVAAVADEEGFEHFEEAVDDFGIRESVEEGGVDADDSGLVEETHLVFAAIDIEGCFAAYGSVDHADEGGGYVDVADAALVACRHKAAEVCDAASAEVDKDGTSINSA